MAKAGRKIGIGLLGVGVALAGIGMAAGGAAAEGGAPTSPTTTVPAGACGSTFTVTWGADSDAYDLDVHALVEGGSTEVSDGTITLTLSNAEPIPNHSLNEFTVGSFDFATDRPVSSIVVRTWQASGTYDHTTLDYAPAVQSGHVASQPGSHPTLGEAPIKGLELCYEAEVEVVPTSTEAPTTTAAPTSTQTPSTTQAPASTAAPSTSVAADSIDTQSATTVPVEVLAQVVTAPEATAARQIAFTGSDTTPLVVVGAGFILAGLALVAVDRSGIVRRGGHSR